MKLTRSHLLFLAASSSVISTAVAANGTWSTDATGNWSDATKWTGSVIPDGVDAIADFSTRDLTAGRTVTVDTTSRTVGTIKFGDTGATGDSAWTLAASGGATLTLATGTAVQPLIDIGTTGTPNTIVNNTVSAPLVGSNGFNLMGATNSVTFNTGSLTSVTGTATITSGRMALQAADLGSFTAVDVKSGGQLGLWNAGTYTQNISIAGTGYGETGFDAALRVANASTTVTLGGTITLTGNATIAGRNGGTGGTIFNGVIGESGGSQVLTFGSSSLNNGTYALNNANTYSGGTTIAFGTVTAGHNQALGSGAVTVNSGAILNVNGSSLANATTLIGSTLTNSSATGGSVGPLTLASGRLGTVSTTGTGTLALGTLTRPATAFVNFTATTPGTISTTSGSASTLLTDPVTGTAYATLGATDWAAKDASNNFIVGLSTIGGYTAFPNAGPVTLTGHADLTDATTVNPVYTLAADSTPSTIRAITVPAATTTATTLALGGFTLTTGGTLANQRTIISGAGSIQPAVAGGELVLNQAADRTTVSSTIADNTSASTLIKTGAGTVTFGNNSTQTYTGPTYIVQGTLTTGGDINSGAAPTMATSGFQVSPGATLMLGNGSLSATQNVTGGGNLSKQGQGFIYNATIAGTNNTYTGSTAINWGTLTVASGAVINGTSGVTVDSANLALLANNGSITTVGGLTVNGANATNAGLFTNGNAGGTTPGTFNAASITLGAANTQTSGTAHGGAFTNNLNSTVTLTGGITVNGEGSGTAAITSSAAGSLFTNSGGTVTSSGSLTLNNSATGNTVSNKGGAYSQTAGTTTVTGALTLNATGTAIAIGAAGNDAAFNLSGGTASFGSASLNGTTTISGSGTLNVAGQFNLGDAAADRSGSFIQTGGTTNLATTTGGGIRLAHWNGGAGVSTVAVSGGAFNALGTTTNLGWDGNSALNVSGTGVVNLKGLALEADAAKTSTVNLTGGTLNIGTNGVSSTGAGTKTINLGAGTVGAFGGNWTGSAALSLTDTVTGTTFNTLDSVDLATGRSITLSGAITGTGKLVKTGAGTLTLSNSNGYDGGTTINSGTLTISTGGTTGAKTGLGTGAVTANAGTTLRFLTGSTSNVQSYANPINLNGATLVSEDGVVTYGGAIALTGSNTVNVVWNGKDATFSNVVSGTGSLTLTNTGGNAGGKLTLSAVNTYTGNTTVSAGTLVLPSTGRLKFLLGATSGTSNALSGVGAATLDGGFSIDTTAADGLSAGTWVLDSMGATSTYNSNFKVYQADGTTAWTDAGGDLWTKPGTGGKTWTFDEATGTLTLASAGGYDAWSLQIPHPADRGRLADPDSDGVINLDEFLFGKNPNASDNSSFLSSSVAGGNLTIVWLQSETGATYTLSESTTLGTGSWTASVVAPQADPQPGDPVGYDQWKAVIPLGAGKKFFRVEATENAP